MLENESDTMEDELIETYEDSQDQMIQCEAEAEEEMNLTTNDSDSLLIELVQGYPYIYDNRCPEFKDVAKKEEAWSDIANAMSWPGEDLVGKVAHVRENGTT